MPFVHLMHAIPRRRGKMSVLSTEQASTLFDDSLIGGTLLDVGTGDGTVTVLNKID